MNITQLKYFNAVCTFHSISGAAAYLHISQPSLSAAIKELEAEFGVSLFRRHHRGVSLTPEGETLYKMCKDILERTKRTEDIMKELGSGRKRLRLGIPPMIGSLILAHIFDTFLGQNPDISIEITEGGYHELLQKLNENYLDLVFLPHDDVLPQGLSVLPVTQLEMVCCAHKNNPLTTHTTVDPEKLKDTPLVLFENSFFQTAKIKEWFRTENIRPKILLQTEQLSTVTSMISNNLAVGFMFRQLIRTFPQVVAIPTEKAMPVHIGLVWKKDVHVFHGMERFISYVKNNDLFKNANR